MFTLIFYTKKEGEMYYISITHTQSNHNDPVTQLERSITRSRPSSVYMCPIFFLLLARLFEECNVILHTSKSAWAYIILLDMMIISMYISNMNSVIPIELR